MKISAKPSPRARRSRRRHRLVFSCEHGGNEIPAEYAALFEGAEAVLDSHRGLDFGALATVRQFGKRLGVEPIVATVSRLVCDLNRSSHHRNVFSEYTRPLDGEQRAALLERYYWPYRRRVERAVDKAVRAGAFALHVSSHSFTPELHGVVRNCDVGFLYDPANAAERRIIAAWHAALAERAPELAIRRNYPYKGTTDALVTYLRRRHGARLYAGVEVEVNQKHVGTTAQKRIAAALTDALAAAVDEF